MKYRLRLTFSTIKSKIQIQNLPDIIHRNKYHISHSASLDSSVECFTFSLRMTTTTFDGTPEILTLCSEWHRDVYILLVPKVLFGNVLKSETQFRTKQSFYDKCVPKQSLGTRKLLNLSQSLTDTNIQTYSSFCACLAWILLFAPFGHSLRMTSGLGFCWIPDFAGIYP